MSIEAMKRALEALEMGLGQVSGDYDTAMQKAIGAVTALRAAIEQAEKPVAWRWTALVNGEFVSNWVLTHSDPPPYATESMPLYTAPRQWVGLADDEIKEIIGPWGETPIKGYTRKLFDQIEAKLRAKNT